MWPAIVYGCNDALMAVYEEQGKSVAEWERGGLGVREIPESVKLYHILLTIIIISRKKKL